MIHAPHPDRIPDRSEPAAVVGWTHRELGENIELRVQSSRSLTALENGRIETARLCMTRNQALLLARYLLDATGQTVAPPRAGWWDRLRGR